MTFQYCMEALAVLDEYPEHYFEKCICFYVLGKSYWDLGVRDKGINYLIQGYELSKFQGIKTEEARGLFFLATSYLDVEEYETALSYLTEADLILETSNPSFLKARCKITLGSIYRELGDYPRAFHNLNSGSELCRILKSPVILARAYNDLAKTYALQQENQIALDYFL
jgi:tetratricopeptide (TPR) repeat protein